VNRERKTEKAERSPGGPQQLEEPHGEDDTTAGTGTDAAAPNSWTFRKPGGSLGSPRGGTAAGNDDVVARERAEVGRLLRGQQGVGGITNMIAKTMKGVAHGQEEREREREVTARTDGGGLEASQHADTTRDDGPKERQQPQQQQQPKPRPKLQLKLQQKPQPVPKPKSAPTPTPARRWETVPPRAKSQRAPVGPSPGPGPGPAPTAGSSMAARPLILRRDESVQLSNTMDQEIASAINRALFHQNAPAHIRIMNAKRNAKGAITAITHPNATAEMDLQYRNMIITAARTVNKGVVDVEENESWERLKIHAVPLIRYIGKGTECHGARRYEGT